MIFLPELIKLEYELGVGRESDRNMKRMSKKVTLILRKVEGVGWISSCDFCLQGGCSVKCVLASSYSSSPPLHTQSEFGDGVDKRVSNNQIFHPKVASDVI